MNRSEDGENESTHESIAHPCPMIAYRNREAIRYS